MLSCAPRSGAAAAVPRPADGRGFPSCNPKPAYVRFSHLSQDVILFVQRLPTGEWEDEQMEVILSKAYMWRDKYGDAGH